MVSWSEAGAREAPVLRRALFEQAERQSRRVRRLRWALPILGVCLALGVIGLSVVSRIGISLAIGDLKITSDGLAMDAPHLSGSDGKGRTYTVSARSAVQSLTDTRIIRLSGIAAHVTRPDGSSADFSADSGVYDAGSQMLTLDQNIVIHGSDGSAASLHKAAIDLQKGTVTSDEPVAFSSNLGEIEAQGMDVTKKAGSVKFGGGVRMTVNPAAVQGAAPQQDNSQKTESNTK